MATAGRILLFGATGFTGRITADELVRAGVAPVLVGRSPDKLKAMVEELSSVAPGGRLPTYEVADATSPPTLRRLLDSPDDVLISTVGPFARIGDAAVEAVIDAGAAYVDSTGEPVFVRKVFEQYGSKAARTGARLLTAMGYDFVPGNLAAEILLSRNPDRGIARLEIGYFVTGPFAASSGTMASSAGIMLAGSHAWHEGQLVDERPGARVVPFQMDGKTLNGISMGGSEHFTLPAEYPQLSSVDVALAWVGRWSRAASAAGAITSRSMQLPGVGTAVDAIVRTAFGGASDEGPAAHQRQQTRSMAMAVGYDASGTRIASTTVEGPNPYDLTGGLLTWSARMFSRRAEHGVGALGPASAFGREALVAGCMGLGLAETD